MSTHTHSPRPLFDPPILRRALIDAFYKLDPRHQARNPVMFVVLLGSILTTLLAIQASLGNGATNAPFTWAIALWLWFTVLFANFAEAMAEGRGKAQADTLRKSRRDVIAKKLPNDWQPGKDKSINLESSLATLNASQLRKDDIVLVEAGDTIPGDGEVMEGVAKVDEKYNFLDQGKQNFY